MFYANINDISSMCILAKVLYTYSFNLLYTHLLQMSVDLKRGETLPIHINMTFPSLPCDG